MGSERRSKRRRSSSRSPSPSRDEGLRRRDHHKRDEGERKSRKDDGREKKERKSDKSRERSRGREEKDKKSKKKEKHGPKDLDTFKELSKDDYFAKNNEFSTWLKEEKDIYFSDLSSDKARELFSSFVKAWNKGKLQSRYYEGIVTGPRTAHNWKIRSQK